MLPARIGFAESIADLPAHIADLSAHYLTDWLIATREAVTSGDSCTTSAKLSKKLNLEILCSKAVQANGAFERANNRFYFAFFCTGGFQNN
ncbi:hypothetical protein TYRP_019464 [Tyrophagus putrescentiae]|nr:hypothetical protein TYRP_019464 [Tyrophagus putrescentiae]